MTKKQHKESILKALLYIESHLDEELSLNAIASVAQLSPYYFHRLFHFYIGKSVGDYIKTLRLNRATKRLCYYDMSITDVAFNVGYENSSSFTKAFHQKMGISPRVYRKVAQSRILERSKHAPLKTKTIIKKELEYVFRKEEKVVFLRLIGDYKTTAGLAFKKFYDLLTRKDVHVERCYAMGLDDPLSVPREQCRFDLCLNLSPSIDLGEDVGSKIISGGHYAVFKCYAPFAELEEIFTSLFYLWHKQNKHKLRTTGAFCEYLNVQEDMAHFSEKYVTAKYHVPII